MARREGMVDIVKLVQGQTDLFDGDLAFKPGGRLTDPLHCGEQQADEDRRDRNHYQ
jgi:hypothetical protein